MKKLILGVVPIKRNGTNMPSAIQQKELILKKIYELCPSAVQIVDMEGTLENGLLWSYEQLPAAQAKLLEAGAEAIFFPHCDFGCEEVVGRLGSMMNLPVLLWGNRDPLPVPGSTDRDTQCGTLASSKCLQRYGVPFSYIINSDVESAKFAKGFVDFCAVANVAKAARRMRILQVGSRPQPFLSVIYNEDELLRRFGIEITPWSSTAVVADVKKILATRADEVEQGVKEYAAKVNCDKMSIDAQRAQQAIRIAVQEKIKATDSDGAAIECWSMMPGALGVGACQVIGMLSDLGIPAACETDVLGAISAVLLKAATLGDNALFFADITVRDAEDDNTELLWHCGPFPSSLQHPGSKPWIQPGGQGNFELKNGPITIARFDMLDGKYSLFSGEGTAVDGHPKGGTYVWLKVDNWEEWEEKIVFGPYIHHVAGAYGNYSQILSEACKFIKGLNPDPVRPVKKVLG